MPNLCIREALLTLAVMSLMLGAVLMRPDHGREARSPDFQLAQFQESQR